MIQYVARDSDLGFAHQTAIRSVMLGGVTALALALGACGGGGGGGSGIASTPTPTPTPTPTTLGPPTVDLLPGKKSPSPAPLFASNGGPTLKSGGPHVLPLTTTAVAANFSGDAATIDQGSSLAIGSGQATKLTINNVVFGVTGRADGSILADGRKLYLWDNTTIATLDLDYTRFGYWWLGRTSGSILFMEDNAAFAGGLETPVGSIPMTGTASYSGKVIGQYSEYYLCACASFGGVVGNVQLSANFGNKTLSGLMTQMQVLPDTALSGFMNDVSFNASFGSLQNLFSGTTAVASMPNSPFALGANASGSIVGSFYGPTAQEIGAVWTLSDGTRRVIGSLGAKKTGN